jgi:hypothetical protein
MSASTRLPVRWGLLPLAALAAAPAHALNLCVDAKGHKVYQQSPCPELAINSGIEPVKAGTVTQQNALETLTRFDAAMAKRDTRAVASFLDEDFRAVVYAVDAKDAPPRHVDGYTRRSFINVFSRNADVMSNYRAARSNCQVTLQDSEALAVCDNRESFTVTSTSGRMRSREHARVVVNNGRLLLRRIDQYVQEFELKTQSVQPR